MKSVIFKNTILTLLKNPRIKVLGVFLVIFSFFIIEPILRQLTHFFVKNTLVPILSIENFEPGIILSKILSVAAPIILIGVPSLVYLWIVIRDGFQKFDWVLGPFLIGIVLRYGVYGIYSLRSQSGEIWELTNLYVPISVLWLFIFLFLISGIVGFYIWLKELS